MSAKSRKAAKVAKAQAEQAEAMSDMVQRMNALESKLDTLLDALTPQKEETGDKAPDTDSSKQADEKMAAAEAQVGEQFADVDAKTSPKKK